LSSTPAQLAPADEVIRHLSAGSSCCRII